MLDHIDGIDFGGAGLRWSTSGVSDSQASADFQELLPELWSEIKEKSFFGSLVIAIDELDSLDHYKDFCVGCAHGLKGIADAWRSDHRDIIIIVSCLTSVYKKLLRTQPSLDRHYDGMRIDPFSERRHRTLCHKDAEAR